MRTVQVPPAPSQKYEVARAAHQTTHVAHLPPGEETRETKQKLELGRAHIRFSKFTSNTVTPHTHAREITHIYSIYRRATAAC